ncbi:MAG TPA: DUF4268 domain-containing protein [Ignavibacteriales bacterium]|nr:DUF4268 domain-containing protein [Ignavibacteriales bacterium]
MIGTLEKITAYSLWQNPEEEFLNWIAANPRYISEPAGFDFSLYGRNVSNYSLNNIFRNKEGEILPVVGQFDEQSSENLGRLIAALALCNTKKGIWVSSNPMDEDIRTVDWLNSLGLSIFFLKIEFVKIGESAAAPMISLVAKPALKSAKRERTSSGVYQQFWESFQSRIKNQPGIFKNFNPDESPRIVLKTGKGGVNWSFFIAKNKGAAELNFEYGWNLDKEIVYLAKKIFREKEKIENKLGSPLVWEESEEKGISRVRSFCTFGGIDNKDQWSIIQADMIDRLKRMEGVLINYLL